MTQTDLNQPPFKTDVRAPLFTLRGVPLALGLAVLLSWPILYSGEIFVFADSASYIRGGGIIWDVFFEMLAVNDAGTQLEQTAGEANPDRLITGTDGAPTVGRSIFYSVLAHTVGALVSNYALVVLQAACVVFAFFSLVDADALKSPWVLAGGCAILVGFTTLPWHAVYLMPDIFGSVVVIFGAVLIGPFDHLSRKQKVVLTLLAAFAAGTHFGNMPLIAGICFGVLIVRLFSGRINLSVISAAAVVVFFAPLFNLAASSVILGSPSITPMRLPIALARSIQDGPALWHLENVCPGAEIAICNAFDDGVPSSIDDLLWAETGVPSLSSETMAQIRDEEFEFLLQVFRVYPVEQFLSLFRNSGRQLLLAGTGQISAVSGLNEDFKPIPSTTKKGRKIVRVFDSVTPIVTLAFSIVLFGLVVSGRLSREQTRIVWVIPAICVVFLAQIVTRNRSTS